MKKFLNNFDTINITPATISRIEHRFECTPYYNAFWSTDADAWCLSGAHLPIFTAPMSCVVNDKNYLEFDKEGVIPIIPRTVSLAKRMELAKNLNWIALSLEEFQNFIETTETLENEMNVCIDVANGHMKMLLDICKEAKRKFSNMLTIMTGNIANFETYREYAKVGVDYVRVQIGSGGACLTNNITGIGYQNVDFLCNLNYTKTCVANEFHSSLAGRYKSVPFVVYDGGCDSIRDIIIALALGCDYVMCGKLFAKCKEAAGEIVDKIKTITEQKIIPAHDDIRAVLIETTNPVHIPGRMYYGMSTERAQREMGNTIIKRSEGTEYWVPIEYTIHEFVSRFVDAITSTMSYCGTKTLQEFIGKVQITRQSRY